MTGPGGGGTPVIGTGKQPGFLTAGRRGTFRGKATGDAIGQKASCTFHISEFFWFNKRRRQNTLKLFVVRMDFYSYKIS